MFSFLYKLFHQPATKYSARQKICQTVFPDGRLRRRRRYVVGAQHNRWSDIVKVNWMPLDTHWGFKARPLWSLLLCTLSLFWCTIYFQVREEASQGVNTILVWFLLLCMCIWWGAGGFNVYVCCHVNSAHIEWENFFILYIEREIVCRGISLGSGFYVNGQYGGDHVRFKNQQNKKSEKYFKKIIKFISFIYFAKKILML